MWSTIHTSHYDDSQCCKTNGWQEEKVFGSSIPTNHAPWVISKTTQVEIDVSPCSKEGKTPANAHVRVGASSYHPSCKLDFIETKLAIKGLSFAIKYQVTFANIDFHQ